MKSQNHKAEGRAKLPLPHHVIVPPLGRRKRLKEAGFFAYVFKFTAYGLVIAAFLGVIAGSLGSALGYYRVDTVLSGSMAPDYKPGDVVVAFAKPRNTTAVGDVIIFRSPEQYGGETVTHRVISAEASETGDVFVRTKGDANDVADPWTARITAPEVWEVRFGIPYVGYISHYAKEWWPLMVALALLIPMLGYANDRVREAYAPEIYAPGAPEEDDSDE